MAAPQAKCCSERTSIQITDSASEDVESALLTDGITVLPVISRSYIIASRALLVAVLLLSVSLIAVAVPAGNTNVFSRRERQPLAAIARLYTAPEAYPDPDDTDELRVLTSEKNCTDTPNWTNGNTKCKTDGYMGVGCTDAGLTCEAYATQDWCKKDWARGKKMNYPELNCCACAGGRISSRQLEQWAYDYVTIWNIHNASLLAEAFANEASEKSWDKDIKGVDELTQMHEAIFKAKPNISITALSVHASSSTRTAVVEMAVCMNDDDNVTLDVMDTIEFTEHGKIISAHGAMAAIADRMPAVDGGDKDQKVLLVKGVPPNANDLYLYKVFSPYGALEDAYVNVNEDGTCAGTASVEFARATDAKKAVLALNNVHDPGNKEAQEIIAPSKDVVLEMSVKNGDGASQDTNE